MKVKNKETKEIYWSMWSQEIDWWGGIGFRGLNKVNWTSITFSSCTLPFFFLYWLHYYKGCLSFMALVALGLHSTNFKPNRKSAFPSSPLVVSAEVSALDFICQESGSSIFSWELEGMESTPSKPLSHLE